jgi:hypothetical protein
MRKEFFEKYSVGTSWGMMQIDPIWKSNSQISLKETLQTVDKYMYAVKYFKLIWPDLVKRGCIQENFKEKNGISYPLFWKDWELIWLKVLNSDGEFFLSTNDLHLIEERKLKINDNNMRNC